MESRIKKEDVRYRKLRNEDLDWVIKRHGEIYLEEFGWNKDFEDLVAKVALSYGEKHDPKKESAWIAEANGQRLGCIFLKASDLKEKSLISALEGI